jgi:hypothetical protein
MLCPSQPHTMGTEGAAFAAGRMRFHNQKQFEMIRSNFRTANAAPV